MSKLGLVLEGGGMRGIYTAGVLDFFMEQNLYTDGVIGVSAGACHACSYVSKQIGRAYRTNTAYLKDKRYMSVSSLLKTGDFFGAKFVYEDIPNTLDPYDFDAFNTSHTKLYAVASNLETGKAEYLQCINMKRDVMYVPLHHCPCFPELSKLMEKSCWMAAQQTAFPSINFRRWDIQKILLYSHSVKNTAKEKTICCR